MDARGPLKVARPVSRLTTACTRPPTRQLSCFNSGAGRRVMPGVMLRCLRYWPLYAGLIVASSASPSSE